MGSSPRSDTVSKSGPSAPTRDPLSLAPDVRLPLRFMVFGLLCLAVSMGFLFLHPERLTAYHYHHHTVALSHLLLLGFGLSVVFGAMYQLVPVALETRLFSERLARWHFPIHAVCVLGMVAMFWRWDMKQVGHFGSGLAVGIAFFTYNLVRTLQQVRGWTPVSFGIASTLFWLVAVVSAGLALSAAKSTYELTDRTDLAPWLGITLAGLRAVAQWLGQFDALATLHAHAHLGGLGVFVLLIVTVAYKLIPMFLISEVTRPRRAWASLICLNLATAGILLAGPTSSRALPVAALVGILGLGCYLTELTAMVRHRRRRPIDSPLLTFLISQGLLVPTALLGLVLTWPGLALTEFVGRLQNLYGFLAVFGVIGLAILGMAHKILPFLVWFAAYREAIGRGPTPALSSMYSARLQAVGAGLWLLGLSLIGIAMLLDAPGLARVGVLLFTGTLITMAINVVRIASHLFRPRHLPHSIRPNPLATHASSRSIVAP